MQRLKRWAQREDVRVAVLIAVCFSLASAAYLGWLYRLIGLVGGAADWLSMGAGYALQAAGTLGALRLRQTHPEIAPGRMLAATIGLIVLFALPALYADALPALLLSGLALNVLFGALGGMYLAAASELPGDSRGKAFGFGYAASTLLLFLLSLLGDGALLRGNVAWFVSLPLAAAALSCARQPALFSAVATPHSAEKPETVPPDGSACWCFALVLLLSLTKNLGFAFPASDITAGLPLEFSRVFYGTGLALAGFVADRDRRQGAICTLAALAMPFLLLSFASASVPAFLCWSLDYLLYGFFTVFRVVLFLDLAEQLRLPHLAPLGFVAGRLGDAAGTALSLALAGRTPALALCAAAGFATSVFFFFRVYRLLYEQQRQEARSEREIFDTFAMQHDFSAREKEVFRLLLTEQPNAAIAEALFVSESTVKFHVHNLLQKTGTKSRKELLHKYHAALYARE